MTPAEKKEAYRAKERARHAAERAINPPRRGARIRNRHASREEQQGRYLDCGPSAWDGPESYLAYPEGG